MQTPPPRTDTLSRILRIKYVFSNSGKSRIEGVGNGSLPPLPLEVGPLKSSYGEAKSHPKSDLVHLLALNMTSDGHNFNDFPDERRRLKIGCGNAVPPRAFPLTLTTVREPCVTAEGEQGGCLLQDRGRWTTDHSVRVRVRLA